MTTLKQAAQQALEALETLSKLGNGNSDGNSIGNTIAQDARTALREALAREHAMHELARLGQEIEQEPSAWRGMIVVTLVREGIDKHKARELADHFAAQRPWQGLTQEEIWKGLTDADWSNIMDRRDTSLDTFQQGVVWAQARLKERNNG